MIIHKTLIPIRHGEGTHNVAQIYDQNAPLTPKGVEQVCECAEKLKKLGVFGHHIHAMYVSPYIRTQETADHLAKHLAIASHKVIIDSRLAEPDFGELEGKHITAPVGIDSWDLPFAHETKGEPLVDVKKRIIHFCKEIEYDKTIEGAVLVISHGTPLRELMDYFVHERPKLNTAEFRLVKLPS